MKCKTAILLNGSWRKLNKMIYVIIILAALTRFIPHLENAAPITALAIFGAIYLPARQGLAIPLAARLISDLVLGFFPFQQMIAVYISHLAGFALGLWAKSSGAKRWALAGKAVFAALISSMVFFLVTNFAWLYPASQYSHDLSGILLAYYNGLPFLRGTLVGDVGYTVGIIVVYETFLYFQKRKQLAYNS